MRRNRTRTALACALAAGFSLAAAAPARAQAAAPAAPAADPTPAPAPPIEVTGFVDTYYEYNFNEVYLNPPTTVCTDNATDANQVASVGTLQEHDDTNMKGEWATNHIAFSSSLLEPGTNQLMVCIRTVGGEAGPGVGNLDNIGVRSVVLHYHTGQ